MYTIGKLARKFGLSRSTLLYYDSIGLLKPSSRTEGAYRQYSASDVARLEQICTYRKAGLALKEISNILDSPDHGFAQTLEQRLDELNDEIQHLRDQQRFILGLLKNRALFDRIGVMNAATWTSLLSACGFSEEDMIRWHVEFERSAPEKHRQFMEFLCIPDSQIETIRSWASSR
ncbi:MAG: MerR family transcriptional regulator [Desulfomonile tiedjei]|nr:MerR family transcriptional regulator [Desulfomonile tiedjei]